MSDAGSGRGDVAEREARARSRRRRRRRVRFVAVAGSLILALLLAEVVVRLAAPVRNVGPSFTTYTPDRGKVLKRSFSGERITPEFTMTFSTNGLGYRGPEPEEPPTGAVLFVGDSFTMGYGVNDGEEFPALVGQALADAFPHVPVVNAGLGDSGQGRWISYLRDRAPEHEPRLVVLQLCGNDYPDNVREGSFRLDPSGRLVAVPPSPPGWRRYAQQCVEAVPGLAYSHLVGALRQATTRLTAPPVDEADRREPKERYPAGSLPLSRALVERALDLCAERGWPAIGLSVEDPLSPSLEPLCASFAERGLPVLHVPTRAERPDLYYAIDGHWNAGGHRYVAKRLTPLVVEALRIQERSAALER